VHINWPHLFYSVGNPGRLSILRNFARFTRFILMLRFWGIPVYWTAHNLYPHEVCNVPGLDWLVRRVVIAASHRVFVHGAAATGIMVEEFPSVRKKVVVIDHGHWVDFYPMGCSRKDARDWFGLGEDEFVFLFVGLCREYKNLDGLIQSFEKIEGDARLVIAGAFLSEAYYKQIRELADRQPPGRVILRAGFVPDEEIQYFLTASDAVVLPYTEILTSGAAVLALSFGRPVIAPRRGYLVDLVGSDCGVLYTIGNANSLLSAMCKAMNQQFDEKQITTRALEHDWGKTAKRMVEVMGDV
jgi:glycosyltransferase involved in cell wall biosynthesis